MNKVKMALYYIWGALQFSFVLSLVLFGCIQFVICMFTGTLPTESNTFVGVHVLLTIFGLILVLFIGCGLLYCVNPTLWNNVHKSYVEEKKDILRMIPDIFSIVSFIFELGFL